MGWSGNDGGWAVGIGGVVKGWGYFFSRNHYTVVTNLGGVVVGAVLCCNLFIN